MTFDESQRTRAEALLGLRGRAGDVRVTDPVPPAGAVGARSALAWRWTSAPVTATVYLLEDPADADAVEDKARAAAGAGEQVGVTANGALLLVARGDESDPGAAALVDELQSSFAGQERRRR